MQVIVDGLLTNYEVSGNGKVVLLLHGWGDDLETFNLLTKELSIEYLVIRLDLPGFGNSEAPESYNLEKFSKFVSSFINKIGYKDLFCIIGHSNGGAIAIKALSNDIIKSSKLVLLASSGVRTQNNKSKKLTRLVFKIAKIPTKLLPKKLQNKIKKKAYKTVGSEMFVAENMQETFKAVVSEDLVEQSGRISINTLLLYGDKDRATPISYGELFKANIKNSELVIIKNAAHFLHHDKPEEVENNIKSFLKKS